RARPRGGSLPRRGRGDGGGGRGRPGVLRRAAHEIPVGRPSADSPRGLRRNGGRSRAAGRPGRAPGRRGDGQGVQRIEGVDGGGGPGGPPPPRGSRDRRGDAGPMIYLLYSYFAAGDHGGMPHYIPFLNLVRYLTFRTIMAMVTALVVIGLMGSRFIDWMRAKQGRGQPIRKEGIERH